MAATPPSPYLSDVVAEAAAPPPLRHDPITRYPLPSITAISVDHSLSADACVARHPRHIRHFDRLALAARHARRPHARLPPHHHHHRCSLRLWPFLHSCSWSSTRCLAFSSQALSVSPHGLSCACRLLARRLGGIARPTACAVAHADPSGATGSLGHASSAQQSLGAST